MGKTFRAALIFVCGISFVFPLFAFAQTGINATYIKGYADSVVGIINSILVPVLISIAFIVFLWGVYKYFIKGAASDTERATGRTFALYGIIGFVILFSLWGIVQIFISTLGLTAGNVPSYPMINSSTNVNSTGIFPGATTNPSTGVWSQPQSSTAVSDAYQTYKNCVTQSGASNCQSQLSAFNNAQSTYDSSGGSSWGAYPLGKCIGGNDGIGGTCPGNYSCSTQGYCISNTSSTSGYNFSCTGTGQSTCDAGFSCQDNLCVIDNSTTDYTSGYNLSCTGTGQSTCDSGFVCQDNFCVIDNSYDCNSPNETTNSYGDCTCVSGYDYDDNNNCVVQTSCDQENETTDPYGDCTCISGYNYDNYGVCVVDENALDCYAPTADTCSDGCMPDPRNTDEYFSCVPE